jgi:hypothetical protein
MLTPEEREKLLQKLNSAVGQYSEGAEPEEDIEEDDGMPEEDDSEQSAPNPKKNMAIIIALKKKMGKK